MRYFSMFSGIGGFELGIQQANSNRVLGNREQPAAKTNLRQEQDSTDSTSELGNGRWECAECIGYSEIDKYAIKVYERNFNGNIRCLQPKGDEVEQNCNDTSDKLQQRKLSNNIWIKNYGDITKINAEELPDFDLLVGGFPCQAFSIAGKRAGFNDTRGTLFFDIARVLKEKRPRNLVLENVKGLLSHDQGKTFQTVLGVLTDLGYFVEWQVLNSKDFGVPQNRERVFIVGHLGGEPRRKVFPICRSGGKANSKRTEKPQIYLGQAQRVRSTKGLAQTLSGLGGGQGAKTGIYEVEPMRIRRLTPLECERLQGFPDNWTEGLSDTQRYKTLGNAVTVNVVEAVISSLMDTLNTEVIDISTQEGCDRLNELTKKKGKL